MRKPRRKFYYFMAKLQGNDALLARGSKGNGNYWPKSE